VKEAGGVAELAVDDRGDDLEAADTVRADGRGVFGQDREVGQFARGDRALHVLLLARVSRAVGVGAQCLGGGDRLLLVERGTGGGPPVDPVVNA
jgi:hypothetical protein